MPVVLVSIFYISLFRRKSCHGCYFSVSFLLFWVILQFQSTILLSVFTISFVSCHCLKPMSAWALDIFHLQSRMTTLQVWAVFGMCVAGNWCPWLQVYIQSTIVVGKPEHCTTFCQETPDGNQVTAKTKAFHDAVERTGREVCLKTTNLW